MRDEKVTADGGDLAVLNAEVTDEQLATLVPQRFAVKDADTADWLVRKVVEADAHIRRVKEQSEREIRRTQRERDFLLMRFGADLERWARKELQKHTGRRKSVLLLSGTVGFRQLAAKLVVDDEPVLLKWARKHCRQAVQVIEQVSKTALNQHFDSTGELPDGVHLELEREKFFIK